MCDKRRTCLSFCRIHELSQRDGFFFVQIRTFQEFDSNRSAESDRKERTRHLSFTAAEIDGRDLNTWMNFSDELVQLCQYDGSSLATDDSSAERLGSKIGPHGYGNKLYRKSREIM